MKKLLFFSALFITPCLAITPDDVDDILFETLNEPQHSKCADAMDVPVLRGVRDDTLVLAAENYIQDYCTEHAINYQELPADLKKDVFFATNRLCKQLGSMIAKNKGPASPEKVLCNSLKKTLSKIIIPGTRYFEGKAVSKQCADTITELVSSFNIPPVCMTKSIKRAINACQEKADNAAQELMKRTKKRYITNHEISKITGKQKQFLIKQLWFLVQGYIFEQTLQHLSSNHANDSIYELPPTMGMVETIANTLHSMITEL
jgi:hypothetical protein